MNATQARHASRNHNQFNSRERTDELRRINLDGGDDRLLLKGRGGDPEHQLCDFKSKQFSSDSRRLYFLNPAWATSDALHAFDVRVRRGTFSAARQ